MRLVCEGDGLDARSERSHDSAIEWPVMDVQFDCLTGISSCFQYFMLREGEVLMRPYSCWCQASLLQRCGRRSWQTRLRHLQFRGALLHPYWQYSFLVGVAQ